MKPLPFHFAAPHSLEEALELLDQHGDEAKVLAGGQSLGPLLNLRLAAPAVLIDLNQLTELSEVVCTEDTLTLGAMVRQHDAEQSTVVADACPLLTEALPFVAHRTIRNRGTVGGSLAHADPAAEIPAVAIAAGAWLDVRSVRGSRTVPVDGFFDGYFTTTLAPDELIGAVHWPKARHGTGSCWQEFAAQHGDFAIVGVAATVAVADGMVETARLACAGIADVPVRLAAAEERLTGAPAAEQAITDAGVAAAEACTPRGDLVATADYRRHLVGLLTTRALRTAVARAEGNHAAR